MSDLYVTFIVNGLEEAGTVVKKSIVLVGDDVEPKNLSLDKVREQVKDKLGILEGWKFLGKDKAVVESDEEKRKVSDILLEDQSIHIRAQPKKYEGGSATYLLHFKFSDSENEAPVTRRFELNAKPGEVTLKQIREKVEPVGGKRLRVDNANWLFVYTGAGDVEDEENATLAEVCSPEEKTSDGKTTFTATLKLHAVESAYAGGDASYVITFEFKGEDPYTRKISLNVGPGSATLESIRENIDSAEIKLRDDKVKWVFTYPNGSEVKNEVTTTLADVSKPVETTVAGSTKFTATVNAKTKKTSGTWDGKPTITDQKLIKAIANGKATEVPVKFPEMPDGKPITGVEDFTAWHKLEAEQRFTIARNVARLYNGFNLPNLKEELANAKPYNKFTNKSVGLPQLDRYRISDYDYWIIGPEKVDAAGANAQEVAFGETSTGHTRLAIERKRNLAITTSAKVTVPEYGSVEAEYSRAEASTTSNMEDNLFLIHETRVPKAEVTLPFGTDGNYAYKEISESNLLRNYRFEEVCDSANEAKEIFQILEDWGALIAKKVTVGGAYFFANVQKVSTDFSEEQITNAWNIKVQGNVSGVDIGAQNRGELSEFQQRQFDQQYSNTIIKAIGGVEEMALNKQYGEWLSTLSNVDLWKPLQRTGILPIYVVLDDYRKKRFARILSEGGEAEWQKNNICKSLKYTNFNWYVSFGQQDTNSRLGG